MMDDAKAKKMIGEAIEGSEILRSITIASTKADKIYRCAKGTLPHRVLEDHPPDKRAEFQDRDVELEGYRAYAKDVGSMLAGLVSDRPRNKDTLLVVSRRVEEHDDGSLTILAGVTVW